MINYFVVLVTLAWLPQMTLSFSFTKEPEQPMVIVLNNNSTNVVFRWEFSLANDDIFSYLNFKRYEKDKGQVSSVTLGYYQPGYTNVNTTLYSLHTNVSNGPSSGYVSFTIKDIMRQTNNKDGSTADARSIDYVYLLVMKMANILDAAVSDVEMRLLVRVHNFIGPKNVSVNEFEQLNVACSADGKPGPNIKVILSNGMEIVNESTINVNIPAYRSMSGMYNCTAENEVTPPQTKRAWLNVRYSPGMPQTFVVQPVNACRGGYINLTCSNSTANPAVSKYFFYNGVKLLGEKGSGFFQANKTTLGINVFWCVPFNDIGKGKKVSANVTVQENPSILNPRINNAITTNEATPVVENEELEFTFFYNGTRKLNETWRRYDGKPRRGKKFEQAFTYGLNFSLAQRNDSGVYEMIARNDYGCFTVKRFNLSVHYKPESTAIHVIPNKRVFCIGTVVQIKCISKAVPDPEYYFVYHNHEILSKSRFGLFNVTLNTEGNNTYTCVSNNAVGFGKNKSLHIVVKEPPKIDSCDNKTMINGVTEGEKVTMICNISGSEPLDVTWTNGNQVWKNRSLIFEPVSRKNDGTYDVTVSSGNECSKTRRSNIQLKVFYPPSNTTIDIPGNRITVKEGESLILNCRSDSRPDATYTWKYNDVLLSSPQNRTLIVKRINRRQSGLYHCEAKSRLGSASSNTIEIVVQYLDSPMANGNTNKSYSQSNPVIWFNLSVNAYPSNVSLSCKSSAPNILIVISNQNTRFSAKQYLVIVIIKSVVDSGSIVCKAEHITGEREITLDFYRQTTVFREEFSGQFEITNQEWQDDLGKSESNRFKILKEKCTKILKAAYDGITFLASIKIKEFLKGSVIVQFQLEVINQVPDPLLPLKTYIKQNGGEIEGLRIDYSSIQKSKGSEPEPISPTENKTIIAAVLGTLFALSIVLNIILIACLIGVRTKDSRRDSEKRRYNNEEMGQTNDITLQETNFSNPGMSAPNSELEYEPIGRRGLATSNPGISEYEAVATGTRPTQPPSGADNPVPQYERVHRRGQPGTPSNQPSAIYRNIPGGQSGNYGSLDPSTRLPHQGTSQTGEYQALQRKVVSPQYQSLDDLSRC